MLFVTVGTHEQPFDRLMREIGRLVAEGVVENVVVQYGYSTVLPDGCRCERFLSYEEMCGLYAEADAVVCHGGPSTFIEAMSYGKVPVVVPRLAVFNEHVNDHQLFFARQFAERVGGIEVVEEMGELAPALSRVTLGGMSRIVSSNTDIFCGKLENLVSELWEAR